MASFSIGLLFDQRKCNQTKIINMCQGTLPKAELKREVNENRKSPSECILKGGGTGRQWSFRGGFAEA